jgi:hypothetical protein
LKCRKSSEKEFGIQNGGQPRRVSDSGPNFEFKQPRDTKLNFVLPTIGLGLLFASAPLFAHHAFSAEYDIHQTMTFQGMLPRRLGESARVAACGCQRRHWPRGELVGGVWGAGRPSAERLAQDRLSAWNRGGGGWFRATDGTTTLNG